LFRLAASEGRGDPGVQAVFADYVALLRLHLGRAMQAAKQAGALPESHNPDAASLQIVALLGLASVLGGQGGFGVAVAELLTAGRALCGLDTAAPA